VTDWKKYVGKRVLVWNGYDKSEVIVREVSPSKKHVCFDFSPQGGAKRVWRDASDYEVLEVLGDARIEEEIYEEVLKRLEEFEWILKGLMELIKTNQRLKELRNKGFRVKVVPLDGINYVSLVDEDEEHGDKNASN